MVIRNDEEIFSGIVDQKGLKQMLEGLDIGYNFKAEHSEGQKAPLAYSFSNDKYSINRIRRFPEEIKKICPRAI